MRCSWCPGNEWGSMSWLGAQKRGHLGTRMRFEEGLGLREVTEVVTSSVSADLSLAPHLWLFPSQTQPTDREPSTKFLVRGEG